MNVCIFSLYSFHLLLLSQQASIAMWTILISKPWWWLLKPKRLTSTLHHNIFTYLDYVFLLSSYCRIYFDPYLLSYSPFGKKPQIQPYTSSNMDDFKTICIYENLLVFAYFLKNGRIYLVSLRNPTFSNIFPRAKHNLNTFKLSTLCARLCIFSLYSFHLLLLSQQASIAMWTILISKPWW